VTSKDIQALSGWMGSGTTRTKTYSGNSSETVTFYDLIGNTGSTGIMISWIDTSPPVCSVDYDRTTPTNQDVMTTLT
jgi:hypothetical protein